MLCCRLVGRGAVMRDAGTRRRSRARKAGCSFEPLLASTCDYRLVVISAIIVRDPRRHKMQSRQKQRGFARCRSDNTEQLKVIIYYGPVRVTGAFDSSEKRRIVCKSDS